VNALRNIHSALVPGGVLVDTQPVGIRPCVTVDGEPVGRLDMTDWVRTVAAVDARVAEASEEGLFELSHETFVVVTDSFQNGAECLETVAKWRGTRIPTRLVGRLEAAKAIVNVEQDVRLRLLQR
jgi:hypothetical protein